MPCGNPRCALSDKINDLRESFGRMERDHLPGFENKFLPSRWRGEHMQKMEPGIAAGTVNSPETIPFYGVRLSTLVSSFLFLPLLRELSDTNCVFLLPESFSEYGKYLYATPSSTLATLKPVVSWEKLSFCLPSTLQHTYKHLHHPSGYENAKGTWFKRFVVFVEL